MLKNSLSHFLFQMLPNRRKWVLFANRASESLYFLPIWHIPRWSCSWPDRADNAPFELASAHLPARDANSHPQEMPTPPTFPSASIHLSLYYFPCIYHVHSSNTYPKSSLSQNRQKLISKNPVNSSRSDTSSTVFGGGDDLSPPQQTTAGSTHLISQWPLRSQRIRLHDDVGAAVLRDVERPWWKCNLHRCDADVIIIIIAVVLVVYELCLWSVVLVRDVVWYLGGGARARPTKHRKSANEWY